MTHSLQLAVSPPPLSLEQALASLREAQRHGQHAQALEQARAQLGNYRDNRDLVLIEGSALRHLGRTAEAIACLDRLAALEPRFSLVHQERGLCFVAQRDAPAAITALLAAVNLNPALPQAWRMLEGVWRLTGNTDAAATAAAHVATLKALPPEVVQATALFADGEATMAEEVIRRFLLTKGDHPEAMRLLARIGFAEGVLDDAETLYAGVLTLAPDHHAARLEYVQTLIARHAYTLAEAALAPLLTLDPAHTIYRVEAATVAVGLGRHDEAIAIYRALLAEISDREDTAGSRADLHLWLGHALKTVGKLQEAITAYRASAAARPSFGDAWWSLANLKTYRFTDDEIAAMRAAEGLSDLAPVDRVHLAFALGKALEDHGEYRTAWEFYTRGNARQREVSRYRPEILETNTAEQKRVCTAAFFAKRQGWGDSARDPIFILGLPRAGSTLIEQILASHPKVEGTQELPEIQRISVMLHGRDPDYDHPRYPAALADFTADDAAGFGARYLAETRVHRLLGRPFFIDKMPNNFRHIGLIHMILPNATVVDVRRDPMACCLSNLKQLFAKGQEFSYSPEDIGRYYCTYLEVMRHWDAALPGKVLRVVHEDVIDDLEGQVHRLLDHCGLPFDPACLAFHENDRAVRTPSSEQVRRPIYRDGMDQWRHFEPYLDELKTALGDARYDWRL